MRVGRDVDKMEVACDGLLTLQDSRCTTLPNKKTGDILTSNLFRIKSRILVLEPTFIVILNFNNKKVAFVADLEM